MPLFAQALEQAQAVHSGQAQVNDGDVKRLGARDLQGPLGAADPVHRITGIHQPELDATGHHDIIFNKQESHEIIPSGRRFN